MRRRRRTRGAEKEQNYKQGPRCHTAVGMKSEEIINGASNVMTGASNDFQQCTLMANALVTQLGMSDVVGNRVID
eukprot:2072667-Heterocapsa_arctica.AAC.1